MKNIKIHSLLFLLTCVCLSAYSQDNDTSVDTVTTHRAAVVHRQVPTRKVTGRIVSAATGQPVAGALVRTAELQGYSTLTEADGSYEFQVPLFASALSVSAPDYSLVKVALPKDGKVAKVSLYPSGFRANYQETTNVLSSAAARDFDHVSDMSIDGELQSRLGADIHSITRSGTPGMGNVMFLGGLNSLHANTQPLVVVDGVILDQQNTREMLHRGFYNNILSNISPADVERVTVLRNGTALYGAKGAAGVILIDTRRNKSMATRITATLSAGVTTEPQTFDLMNGNQYRTYASELLKTTNTTATSFKFLNENPDYYYYKQYHNDTNWKDGVYRTAFNQNYGINVEGGDDVANYNLSLGYNTAQSTLEYNSANRLNVRFNTDVKFSSHFMTRFDASFANQTRKLRDDGAPETFDSGTPTAPSFLAHAKSPFLSPYIYSNGQLSIGHYDVNDESYLNEALRSYSNYNWQLANPYALNKYADAENKNRFENSMFNVNITPRYLFGRHLFLSEQFSYNLISTNELYYIPVYGVPSYYVQNVGGKRENEVQSLAAKQNSLFSDTRLGWQNRYSGHDINIFGGVRMLWDSYTLSRQLGYNTGNDKTPQIRADLKDASTSGLGDSWNSIAWYGQAEYNYLQRYFLQLNLTAESSSRFGSDADGLKMFGVQWGLFPGAQASWVLTNEPALARIPGVNYLRLSGGFDISGNDNIDSNASRSYFRSITVLGNVSGLAFDNIGNNRLKWETTRRMNIGLEGNFLGNRLNLRLNYFRSKTDDLLTMQTLRFVTGLEQNWNNGGALRNEGFDVHAMMRMLTTRNWQWELGASVGHYKNEVTRLSGDGSQYVDTEVYGATIRTQLGQAANLFYGYRTKGVFATSEEAVAANLYVLGQNGIDRTYFQAGDIHFQDMDNNGCIDDNDRAVIGDPNPDIFGNIFTSISFRRLRLDVIFNYSLGNDVYNYFRQQMESGERFINQTTALTRRWHGEGHQTDIPRITFQDPMGNSRFSDRWIDDGSNLRMKTVTLSYRLPINSEFIQGLEFWAQANNVFTLTRYLGGDPESAMTGSVIGQGIDTGLLPQSRSFVLGMKINL